jgi:hypothetical protein
LELKDLFRSNINSDTLKPNEIKRENIFCESCQLVINKPTKHCKLCEHCCQRFDHHCLFLLKCIGINNHRLFLILLASSIACIIVYLSNAFPYIKHESSLFKDESIFYFIFSSNKIIWLVMLIITNIFGFFMLSFLLIFQLQVTSHGFTAQFRPGDLKRLRLTFKDKLNNLKIFFFDSNDELMALYLKQAKADYILTNRKREKKDALLGASIINMGHHVGDHNGDNCSDHHGHSH